MAYSYCLSRTYSVKVSLCFHRKIQLFELPLVYLTWNIFFMSWSCLTCKNTSRMLQTSNIEKHWAFWFSMWKYHVPTFKVWKILCSHVMTQELHSAASEHCRLLRSMRSHVSQQYFSTSVQYQWAVYKNAKTSIMQWAMIQAKRWTNMYNTLILAVLKQWQ